MPRKAVKSKAPTQKGPKGMSKSLPPGIVITDLTKKKWKLGPVIGQGGFGYIYLGSPEGSGKDVTIANAENVIKVEPHNSGPLFVELAFYQRAGKSEKVTTWLSKIRKSYVGVPVYIATGSFEDNNQRYRFLVIDRFGTDVEKLYAKCGYQFPEKTVFSLGLRVLDALEYIHEHEYCHADIKSSNLMMGLKKINQRKVYLLDYGLASRYNRDGVHTTYKEDPKRKHDGTIEYTSRDAHKGCAPARRGDLEILGYCMVQWLCRKLPWENKLSDKDYVMAEKIKYMGNIKLFMQTCFPEKSYPDELQKYLQIIADMEYTEKPDYEKLRALFTRRLKQLGADDDGISILLPTEGAVESPSKTQKRGRQTIDDVTSPNKRTKRNVDNSPKKTIKRGPKSIKTPVKNVVVSPVKKTPKKTETVHKVLPKGRLPARLVSPKKPATPRKLKAENQSNSKPNLKTNHAVVNNGDNTYGNRVVHLRPRKRNVKMVDFGQSP